MCNVIHLNHILLPCSFLKKVECVSLIARLSKRTNVFLLADEEDDCVVTLPRDKQTIINTTRHQLHPVLVSNIFLIIFLQNKSINLKTIVYKILK